MWPEQMEEGRSARFSMRFCRKPGSGRRGFTSPHLVRVTERFSFDGQEADDALFLEAFEGG